MTRTCCDCPTVFIPANWRAKRCRPCADKAFKRQQLESQKRRRARGRPQEPFDISAAEIEQRFQAALKESRRQSSGSLEPFRSYSWLYKEPRS